MATACNAYNWPVPRRLLISHRQSENPDDFDTNVSESYSRRSCISCMVSRTINTLIPLLACQLQGLLKWPRTTIRPTDPPYNHLPNAVAIIDGTENFIQQPLNLNTQKSSYSDYKSNTTVKYLVSIDPFTGSFNFVSRGFSGNASDKYIVENSSFLNLLLPGQWILAGRGFTARDLIAKNKVFLTIPSFLRSSSKYTAQQAMETRSIASVQIRVENAIKTLKGFPSIHKYSTKIE